MKCLISYDSPRDSPGSFRPEFRLRQRGPFFLLPDPALDFGDGRPGLFVLGRKPGAKYGFLGIGVVTVAVMITGTRTPFVFVIGSAFVMTAAFLWGAPGDGDRDIAW